MFLSLSWTVLLGSLLRYLSVSHNSSCYSLTLYSVIHSEFNVYPLWICPMRIFPSDAGFVHPTKSGEQMFVDIGVYGIPGARSFKALESTRAVEEFVRQAEGFQMLYADMYQDRAEFRAMFDHSLYDRMRTQTNATKAFPEVFDKVCSHMTHSCRLSSDAVAGLQGQPLVTAERQKERKENKQGKVVLVFGWSAPPIEAAAKTTSSF